MKVAIVSTYDTLGGSARAAFRLHKGLLNKNISSHMLVQQKDSDNANVLALKTNTEKLWSNIAKRLNNIPLKFYPKKGNYNFSPSYFGGFSTKKHLNKYDVFNLHWIADGFLNIDAITNITKPLVLTLHDSWAFTGGCHLPYPCDKFLTKCGSCVKLGSNSKYDLSTHVWTRKYEAWQNKQIVLVGDGNWVANNAKNSPIFKNHRVEVIHPGLDLNVFKPLNKKFCREILNIEEGVKVILFGALSAVADTNKGFQYLVPALKKFIVDNASKQKVKLIVFGSSGDGQDHFGIDTQYMGKIHDDTSLAILYSAADVMIVPSIVESFGQTASESFACGTPVVAFKTSGLKDIVDHQINGFLAEAYDYNDLAQGISWVLDDDDRLVNLGIKAREKAVRKFSIEKYVDDYVNVYESVITGSNTF